MGFQKSVCVSDLGDRCARPSGMIVSRVVASPLLDLSAAAEPAVATWPFTATAGHRRGIEVFDTPNTF